MKRTLFVILICTLAFVSVFAPVAAQDVTATPSDTDNSATASELTNCDLSLVLLYGLASRFFGFDSPSDTGMRTGTGIFEYGQFGPFFDMSTVPQSDTETDATDTSLATAEATADDAGKSTDTDASNSVFLNPPLIADENPSCVQLRTELEKFFASELLTSDWDARFRGGMWDGNKGGAEGSN